MDKKLDTYLQTLESELSDLREQERAGELREVRQHLESLVSRLEESGLSREEALTAALAQFGDARRIGGELCRVSTSQESRGRVTVAVLSALLAYVFPVVFVAPKLVGIALDFGLGQARLIPTILGFASAFIAGMVAGTIAPQRGGRATLWTFGSGFGLIYGLIFFAGALIPIDGTAVVATLLALWMGASGVARRAKLSRQEQA